MNEDEPTEAQLGADIDITPLKLMVTEAHEVYKELVDAGFPERVISQILGNMLADALVYRIEHDTGVFSEDEDEDDDDFGL